MSSHRQMLLAFVLGAGLGLAVNAVGAADHHLVEAFTDYIAFPVGQIFLRLLFMLVIPLLFAAIVVGVTGLELANLGRVAVKTLGYTIVMSSVAVTIGLVAVNALRPGEPLPPELREQVTAQAAVQAAQAPKDTSPVALIVGIIPDNPLRAAANGDMLGVIAFSLIFGIGLMLTEGEGAARVRAVIEGLYDVTMRLLTIVLKLAPYGVAALLFTMTSRLGLPLLKQLAAYVGVVLLGLTVHMVVVYSLSVRFLGGLNPLTFFRAVRLAIVTAFATSSSNATLPTALKVAEENLRLPPSVSRFVLTAGSTMNQNGTALFEGVTVLFLAQTFGVELSLPQQALVMAISILAGIGTAGVPAGSIPVIAMILGMLGIPPEGIGLILGIDRFLDMCRTTLNVTGDLAAAVYVSRGYRPAA